MTTWTSWSDLIILLFKVQLNNEDSPSYVTGQTKLGTIWTCLTKTSQARPSPVHIDSPIGLESSW